MSRRRVVTDVVRALAAARLVPHRFRPSLLRFSGLRLGEGSVVLSGLHVTDYGPVSIGTRCFINHHAYLDNQAEISIGDDVQIGDHVRIITSSHSIGPTKRRAGTAYGDGVRVGAGCWIGSGVTLLPGVELGDGCVVAAGSVVTKSIGANKLLAGVPAIEKRAL